MNVQSLLHGNFGRPFAPAWSPDGTHIAFIAGYLYVMNADGSNLRPLTQPSDVFWIVGSLWSPDSTQIAYLETDDLTTQIYVTDIEGQVMQPLLTREFEDIITFQWSPDGTQILFTYGSNGSMGFNPYVVNVNTGELRALPQGGSAAWSPHGTEIVFTSSHGAPSQLCIMNVETTEQRCFSRNRGGSGFLWLP